MGLLVDGKLISKYAQYRHWVTSDGPPGPSGSGGFQAEIDRYYLYVALEQCPLEDGVTFLVKTGGFLKIYLTCLQDRGAGFFCR
ncbi:MAG: hypothetical protein COA93_06845 [Alphaproteobacteria bacterium]|nr:MAG: hypothetical protein COA93_06845 [Alphaproteobacteria bacterium]